MHPSLITFSGGGARESQAMPLRFRSRTVSLEEKKVGTIRKFMPGVQCGLCYPMLCRFTTSSPPIVGRLRFSFFFFFLLCSLFPSLLLRNSAVSCCMRSWLITKFDRYIIPVLFCFFPPSFRLSIRLPARIRIENKHWDATLISTNCDKKFRFLSFLSNASRKLRH